MAVEWRNASIGALCDAGITQLQTGPFGSQLHARDYVADGTAVVPTEAIRNRRIDHSLLPKISLKKARELARHRLCSGDILFARRGAQATGHIGVVRPAEEGFICGTGAIRLRVIDPLGGIDADYLSHVLANPASIEWFKFHAIGATMPNLNEGIIRSFPLAIPSPTDQRAIAHFLGTLDDKIELNRRMSETLEEVARAIFTSWFVAFDPVRAKAAGRDPLIARPCADLFPDRLDASEQGETPRGWRRSHLGEEVVTVLGGTPSRAEPSYWGGDIPWINSGEANRVRIVEPTQYITKKGLKASASKLLPTRTTVIAITGATLGQISLTEIETCANQSIVGVLGTTALPSEFLYFWVREHVEDLLAHQTGGAQQHINKNNVNELPVLCPSAPVIAAYIAIARPLFDRIKGCYQENATLAGLRATLGPRLISGQLRVPQPEATTRAAPP